jgi:hypothetical protein
MAVKSRRQADYVYSTFAAILAWAFDRGLVPLNPCERPGCVFHAMMGSHSTGLWARILGEGGQRLHGIVGRFDRQSNGIGVGW